MQLSGFRSAEAASEFHRIYERAMSNLPTPTDSRDITTTFGTVRVYRFGSAGGPKPLVLLPGRAGTSVMWQEHLDRLTASRTVYCIEPLGEPGPSIQATALSSAEDQATWLTEVIGSISTADVHLIGYSFGGWLACNQLIHGGASLASTVLIDPVSTFGRFPLQLLLRTALTTIPVLGGPARKSFMRWVIGGAPLPTADAASDVIETGLRTFKAATPMPTYPTDDQLRTIDRPVLVIIAGRSVMHHPSKAVERARNLIQNSHCELWPEATHAIISESAAEVDKRILQFVEQIEQQSSAGVQS